MFKWVALILMASFSLPVAQTDTKSACANDEMIDAVNNVASNFATDIAANDDVSQAFDAAQVKLADIRTKCLPEPEGIHVKSDSGGRYITPGKLPDGKYEVSVLHGGVLIVVNNLLHDNSGCTWDEKIPFTIRGNNPVALTAKNCDLQLLNPTGSSLELVFTFNAEPD